jgi:uncharacterized protein with FMN-binding domain
MTRSPYSVGAPIETADGGWRKVSRAGLMSGTRDRTLSNTPGTSTQNPRTSKPGQRVSHGLVALSSAVVMAVYSAGYLRTQDAADRFEAEAGQRRPAVPDPAPAAAGTPEGTPPAIDAQPVAPEAEAPARPPAEVGAKTTPAIASPASIPEPVAKPKPSPTSAAPATSATPVANPVAPVPVESGAAARAPEPASAIAPAGTTAPEPAPAAPAAPAAPRYKDGTYTGWGTSRHGDIEAQVVIINGRITSATIAQCLTRWPCSWIEALPGQVVARQSPETDFVSGATQSTDAFYYAVVQALGKAALP